VAEAVGILLIVAGMIPAARVRSVCAGRRDTDAGRDDRAPGGVRLHRHVRNPIYLAAMTIFVREALLFGQLSMLLYTIAVWVGAAAFVRWYEEPALAARFGADYGAYRRAVPAWRPRLRLWTPDDPDRRDPGTGGAS